MSPHLVKWDKAYRKKGLTIIDVNNGAIDKQAVLAKYVRMQNKTYPTLWDKGAKVCKSYAVRSYPTAFLIGVDGKVVWEGYPVPELATLEKRITKELAKVVQAPEKQPGDKPTDKPEEKPKEKREKKSGKKSKAGTGDK